MGESPAKILPPQWGYFSTGETAAVGDWAGTQFPSPLQGGQNLGYGTPGANKGRAIEILKVEFEYPETDGFSDADEILFQAVLADRPIDTSVRQHIDNPALIAFTKRVVKYDAEEIGTNGGAYYQNVDAVDRVDLTDGRGHGWLTAAENLYCYSLIQGQTAEATTNCWGRYLYRFVDLPMLEVIGMLSQMQQPISYDV